VRIDDPDLVRREYADEGRFAVRRAAWDSAVGADPRDVLVEALSEAAPRSLLEVGCGTGELAERIQRELCARIVALDLSDRMVELSRARGVDARRGDAQQLPFPDGSFDCALAAWMLYHVPDRGRALAELARVIRPGGRLVAVTNGAASLGELWGLFGEAAAREHPFSRENGEEQLRQHFERVERRDVNGTITFRDHAAARAYVAASVTRSHLAARLPSFEGPLRATRAATVFVAERAA
jgi:SAM-dependent methyltransferase